MPEPVEPYLRPATPEGMPPPDSPEGWTTERAGMWDGAPMEVVYNPRRHDVVIIRGRLPKGVSSTMQSAGFTEARAEAEVRMFIRDRSARVGTALDRLEAAPAATRELGRSA